MGEKTAGVGHFTIPTAPAAGTSCTSGAANVFTTTYVQMIASTVAASYITGLYVEEAAVSAATYIAVQIATGGAGSETIVGQYLVAPVTGSTVTRCYRPIFPPIPVAISTRIAVKTADSVGAAAKLITLEMITQANVVDDGVAVGTVTTVTNQLTAAAVATGVWQDATAGDFTTANSIGKALYINNVAPGGTGGHLISGSNSGTTTFGAVTVTGATTLTGNVSIAAGMNITQTTANADALVITGNGSGNGINATGGAAVTTTAGGVGIKSTGGASSTSAGGVAGVGMLITGGAGSASTNGAVDGAVFVAGGTNTVASTASGIKTTGTSIGHGFLATSGAGATGDGIKGIAASTNGNGATFAKTGTGQDFNATSTPLTLAKTTNITGFNDIAATAIVSSGAITTSGGAVSTVSAVTGLTAANLDTTVSSRMATYTQPTGFLAATFPSGTIANTTNLTAGTVATVTNAIVLPSDLTATMKTSVTTACTAATPTVTTGTISAGAINAASIHADTGLIIRANTATASAASTLTLDAGASATDNFYNNCWIVITSSTGIGQVRRISGYVGSTLVATVSPAWTTTPSATSKFSILPAARVDLAAILGTASAGAAGYAGIDWSAVNAPTSTVALSGTTVGTITTYTGNTVQTGDSFARIGVAGVGLTNLGDTRIANLDATVSSRMATYTQPTGFLAATFPSGTVANTTNITAGVITTVTNLTNAPTAGDFNATMKTSLNAATPASVTGAVGSVTGNIGGNVVGTVASVVGAVGSVTGSVGSVTGAVGSVTGNVGGNVVGTVASVVGAVGSVVGLTVANLDVAVSTRLASASYTAPSNASIATILATTNNLTFTVAGKVDVNTKNINDVPLKGAGTAANPWAPV